MDGSSSRIDPSSDNFDLLFKLIIIGDTGTGKSCLLHQFIERAFQGSSSHTIGVEFGSRLIEIGGQVIKLQIWDTAGQERFRSVTRSYYRGAAGALLVYDIASRDTFTHVASWLRDARTLAGMDVSTVLIGNKLDLRLEREVPFLEAARFAQENDLMFLEASAMTGEGVDECFLKVARAVMSRIENGLVDPSTTAGIQIGTGTTGTDSGKRPGGCIC